MKNFADEVRAACRHLSPCIYPECSGGATRCDRFADGYAAGKEAAETEALRDAIRETALIADELAFWKYQAIWGRAYLLQPEIMALPIPEESPAWAEAKAQLEEARAEENRERLSDADALKKIGR